MEPVAPDTTSTPIPNPFDLPGMALSQDYLKAGSVRKLPIKKKAIKLQISLRRKNSAGLSLG
jgi:hypothetical protein